MHHRTTALTEQPYVALELTGGLTPGSRRDSCLFHLMPTGVEFVGEMKLGQWREGMRMLKLCKSSLTVWLADFIRYGTEQFGQDEVEQTIVQMEFDLVDAQRAIAIGKLDPDVRNIELSPDHYWVLSKANLSPMGARHWSQLSVKHRLTAHQLAESIAKGRVVTCREHSRSMGRSSGIATPHGIRQSFDLWWKQVEKEDPIEAWDRDRKAALLEELRPVAKIVQDLETDLSSRRDR